MADSEWVLVTNGWSRPELAPLGATRSIPEMLSSLSLR